MFFIIQLATSNAQGHWESKGAQGKNFCMLSTQNFLQLVSRHGQLGNMYHVFYMHWSVFSTLTFLLLKVLLIVLPKRSLIESRQCNMSGSDKRKKMKQCENAAWKGKITCGPLLERLLHDWFLSMIFALYIYAWCEVKQLVCQSVSLSVKLSPQRLLNNPNIGLYRKIGILSTGAYFGN